MKTRTNINSVNRKLEIGAGTIPKGPEYEQLDQTTRFKSYYPEAVFHLHVAEFLPFEDDTFDELYSSNVLEHFPWWGTTEILGEWLRVVKLYGVVELIVPDIWGMLKDYWASDGDDFDHLVNRLYGDGDYKGNWHQTMFHIEHFEEFIPKLAARGTLVKMEDMYPTNNEGGFHVDIVKMGRSV